MMKLVALCFLLAFAVCQAEDMCYSLDCANIRYLNVLPPLGAANVTAGKSAQLITNAAPVGPTDYSTINANVYRLKAKFQRGGEASSQPHNLGADRHYTMVTKTNGNSLDNVLISEDVRAPSNANKVLLRAANFLAENTVLTVSDQKSGRTLFRNLDYGEVSNWKEIASGDYVLVWSARRTGNQKRTILQVGNGTCCWYRASTFYITPSGTSLSAAKIITTSTKRSEGEYVPEFVDLSTSEAAENNNENHNNNNNNAAPAAAGVSATAQKVEREVKTENQLSPAQAQAAEKVEARE